MRANRFICDQKTNYMKGKKTMFGNDDKKDDKAVALFGESETMPAHIAEGSGLGNENVSDEDVAMPYLNVLQALSPEVEEVDGAKQGMLYNSITKELYDEVYVMNLSFSKAFAIFKKRDLGGGFEGAHPTRELAAEHLRDNVGGAPSDYDIVETHRHVCLLVDPVAGTAIQPIVLNLSNTKVRVSKAWNSEIKVKGGDADRFAGVWRLATVKQSNSSGSWYNLKVDFAGWAPEALYNEGKGFYQNVAQAA